MLYYLAYEYEQAQDLENARKVYYELIQKAPQSKYIPNAYLAFGELFFNEAQGDPSKWELAAQAYQEVIKYPPPNNKVFGYAHYKLAYVYWNKGEFPRALDEFKKTIDYGDAVRAAAERRAARRTPRVATSSRSTRSRATRARLTTSSSNLSGDSGGRERQDVQDDGRPRVRTTSTPVTTPRRIALYHDLMSRDKRRQVLRVPGARRRRRRWP